MTDLITDPIQTRRALFTWQRPLEQPGSRDRFAVAELLQCEGGVAFSYLDEGSLAPVMEAGFRGYPGLALGDAHEAETALDVLARRLPPRDRPDFHEFLETFGLSPQADFSNLSLLAYTGARVTGDSFGVTETFDGFDRPFRYVFDVSGYRHYRNDALDLAVDEPLIFRLEPTNEYDSDAIEIARENDVRLGYINRLQAQTVRGWIEHGNIDARVFKVNGRSAYPRLFVMADIEPAMQKVHAA